MKKFYLSLALFFFSHILQARQTIKPEEVNKHIGETVTVCGKIYGGKFLDAAKNQPTFLNMGAAYPKQFLTIVIWGNMRTVFTYKPEVYLNGKTVCITGKIELFKEKPQIILYDTVQLKVR